MSARDDILHAIRTQRVKTATRPPLYNPPMIGGKAADIFAARAIAANASVTTITAMDDVPGAVAEVLRRANLELRVHAPSSAFDELDWPKAAIVVDRNAPGPDDAALAVASIAIAETGTLVYPAAADRPASWHFRAGLEIAVLREDAIVNHLEDALARLRHNGTALPHTVNLVTGPSRTGDIEQTMELGAHGPKALVILIVKNQDTGNAPKRSA